MSLYVYLYCVNQAENAGARSRPPHLFRFPTLEGLAFISSFLSISRSDSFWKMIGALVLTAELRRCKILRARLLLILQCDDFEFHEICSEYGFLNSWESSPTELLRNCQALQIVRCFKSSIDLELVVFIVFQKWQICLCMCEAMIREFKLKLIPEIWIHHFQLELKSLPSTLTHSSAKRCPGPLKLLRTSSDTAEVGK